MDKNMYSCSKKDGCPYQTGDEQLKSAHDRIDELESVLRVVGVCPELPICCYENIKEVLKVQRPEKE